MKCTKCGRPLAPEHKKCLFCGAPVPLNGGAPLVEGATYATDVNTYQVTATYTMTCPNHGRVVIKSSVLVDKIKCPFC